jgi:ATP-dependent DNA helicase RecG
MKPSIHKLQKYINLEAERGYDNRAVMGGLDRILERWQAEARIDGLPEDLIEAVAARIRDYPRLAESSRAEVLDGLMRRLQRDLDIPVEALPQKTTPERLEREESSKSASQESPPKPSEPSRPIKSRPKDSEETAQLYGAPAALNASVTVLSNVGPRHAQTLSRLGLNSLGDMLYHFPRRYDDYSQLKPINRLWYGEEVTIIGTVQSVSARPIRGGKAQLVEAVVSDGSGAIRVNWFNQAYIAKRLHKDTHIVLSGKVEQYLGRLVMNNPEMEQLEQQQLHTNRIVPVYPLTANITQRWLRRLMNQVVTYWAPRVQDYLPLDLRKSADLFDLPRALLQVHFPDSWDDLNAARHRLAFDEIFMLQLGVLRQKRTWQNRTARVFEVDPDWMQAQTTRLPFPLTGAQERVLADISHDLASGQPMNRLIQGDVGSGKTVVAALAIALVTRTGAQTAMMAPTSILAEQHYKSMLRLLCGMGVPTGAQPQETSGDLTTFADNAILRPEAVRLMIGATPEVEKREIRDGLENGTIKVVVGTHALIEDPVVFQDLQLAIVDEQHRFGVEQRGALRAKGNSTHLLVMTATPIPRSLALTVYGDLDLSLIDEMPPGRQPVATYVLPPRETERAYNLIRSQIVQGRQAFIIYPLVEESEKSDSKAAVEEHERLQNEIFPGLKLGLLHGRMKGEEKDEIMTRFRDGVYDILVSTSVIEVGVDVPNATVMLIEGANRFGLAQLHQFRGRVGRGSDESYCLLIPESADDLENERLKVMAATNDGFVLADKDLEQRGPGQFLGTRQSGFAELRLASLTDVHLIEKARHHAQRLFEDDPDLEQAKHQPLNAALQHFWGEADWGGEQEAQPKGDIS